MSLTFRICSEEDIALADAPFIAAYEFPTSQQKMLHEYWELQPDGWWLALLDGNPVGFGGAVDYGAFSYVGMIAVHPSVQGRGIGEALMHHIVEWGKARNCPTLILGANLKTISLYQRVGFIAEGYVLRLVRTEHVPFSSPSPALDLLRPSDIPELTAFDATYFGAQRAKIFTQFLASYPGRAFVTRSQTGQMTGYIFAQKGFLGPWVASTVEDAQRLLMQALSLPFVRTPTTSFPERNTAGQEILKQYGFREESQNCYMYLGAPADYRQLAMIYGETSPALG